MPLYVHIYVRICIVFHPDEMMSDIQNIASFVQSTSVSAAGEQSFEAWPVVFWYIPFNLYQKHNCSSIGVYWLNAPVQHQQGIVGMQTRKNKPQK